MSGLTHSLNKGGNIRCWLTLWNHKIKNTINNITLTVIERLKKKKDKAHSQYILLQSASSVFIHKLFRLVWLANVIFSLPEMCDSSACFFYSFRDDFRFRWKRIVPTKVIYNESCDKNKHQEISPNSLRNNDRHFHFYLIRLLFSPVKSSSKPVTKIIEPNKVLKVKIKWIK